MISPDLAGFRDAQIMLREAFSSDIPFFTPTAPTWPSGTQLDPETGRPYDPAILPLASGFASAAVPAEVFDRVLEGERGENEVSAIGRLETGKAVLAIAPADWSTVEDATEVEVRGERYRVTQSDDSGVAGLDPDRRLIWIEQL